MKHPLAMIIAASLMGCTVSTPRADGPPRPFHVSGDCPDGASFNPDGSCVCDPFFSGKSCLPVPPPRNLERRSISDVCGIWNDQYQRTSTDFWMEEPGTPCYPGALHPDELRQALHATSQYRLLVGLYPVSLAEDQLVNTQQCATMHNAMNVGLLHTPPRDWACYTQSGYDGCSSSNLGMGIEEPARTVELYVRDQGVASLGHRRWIFNPSMGATAFGQRGRYGAMYAFDTTRDHDPEFVAYPSPGPFPRAALQGQWSIHGGAEYTDQFGVEVERLEDGSVLPVQHVTAPAFTGLASTLAWAVPDSVLSTNTSYRVTITAPDGRRVRRYETTLVACASDGK